MPASAFIRIPGFQLCSFAREREKEDREESEKETQIEKARGGGRRDALLRSEKETQTESESSRFDPTRR